MTMYYGGLISVVLRLEVKPSFIYLVNMCQKVLLSGKIRNVLARFQVLIMGFQIIHCYFLLPIDFKLLKLGSIM